MPVGAANNESAAVTYAGLPFPYEHTWCIFASMSKRADVTAVLTGLNVSL